jgi:predicted ribosome quality control (RQC) complex YloA/Tae2 family protein
VLTRLVVEWSSTLVGMRLGGFRQESADRFRLAFASEHRDLSLIVSLDPTRPWIGEAVRRWDGPRWSPDPFVAMVTHTLVGRLVAGVSKLPPDRAVRLDFGDGTALVCELATHGANLVVLGPGATVEGGLRHPKGAKERLTPGRLWSERGLPLGRDDPFGAEAIVIDAVISEGATRGESPVETLRRHFIGLGPFGPEVALDEERATGRSLGCVLRDRLDSILDGTAEVLIEEPDDPSVALGDDVSELSGFRLLPWRPDPVCAGRRLAAADGPARTAATFFEARDAAHRVAGRIRALGGILSRELTRTQVAERKVQEGLRTFEDPERFRRMGEALLASLSFAKRSGDAVVVADPYDPEGREIVIPAPPTRSLHKVADDLFNRQRRARRGLDAAGARAEALARRAARLGALLVEQERTSNGAGAARLEAEMRAEGLPVGLVGPTRTARAAARVAPPTLDGVRMIASAEGWTILVGRTARDNDRLTFKLAAPEDIWLHAAGVHGAHVVIRNPDRLPAAPPTTLAEAARLALWFSEARSEAAADVHWTRRKNVRRAKGGASGQVVLKRFETIRVRPSRPEDDV